MSRRKIPLPLLTSIGASLVTLCCLTTQTYAQVDTSCSTHGVLVTQGQGAAHTGELNISSYRLEISRDKTFCLSVGLDSGISGAFLIWVNDDPRMAYSVRKGEVTASFPVDWLENDATLSLSTLSAPYQLTTLRERLRLPQYVMQLQKSRVTGWIKITSMRRVNRVVNADIVPFVRIEITRSTPFEPVVGNNTWVVQIGTQEFFAAVEGEKNRLVCTLSPEEFAELKNGDPVRVNWGFGALSHGNAGKSFAKLDKIMLD